MTQTAGASADDVRFIAKASIQTAGFVAQTTRPTRAWGKPCAHGWRCSLLAVTGPVGAIRRANPLISATWPGFQP
jgi:hypothetical protein